MRTKHDLFYRMTPWAVGGKTLIPKGTKVIPARNLPEDSEIKYWAEPWEGMTEEEESHERNYGFGLYEDEVEP